MSHYDRNNSWRWLTFLSGDSLGASPSVLLGQGDESPLIYISRYTKGKREKEKREKGERTNDLGLEKQRKRGEGFSQIESLKGWVLLQTETEE